MGNDELVNMYEKQLGDAGYVSFKLARTNNRGDGMYCFGEIWFNLLWKRTFCFFRFACRKMS